MSSAIIHVLGMQVRLNRIVEASNFAARQDEPLDGAPVARTAFVTVAQMDRANFVLVDAIDPVITHSD
jgi:hypothetical protein